MSVTENRNTGYYFVDDVKELMGCSEATAYRFIRTLNSELQEKGYLTVHGRVSKAYFDKRYYNGVED